MFEEAQRAALVLRNYPATQWPRFYAPRKSGQKTSAQGGSQQLEVSSHGAEDSADEVAADLDFGLCEPALYPKGSL